MYIFLYQSLVCYANTNPNPNPALLWYVIWYLQKRWAQKEAELRESMRLTNDPNSMGAGNIVNRLVYTHNYILYTHQVFTIVSYHERISDFSSCSHTSHGYCQICLYQFWSGRDTYKWPCPDHGEWEGQSSVLKSFRSITSL